MLAAVDLWLARFDMAAPTGRWRDVLDDEERRKADRFADPATALAYMGRHALLRHVLGQRLGQHPRTLVFTAGPLGKPALLSRDLAFSLSGSGLFAMLAVGDAGDIGVDLERIRPVGLEAARLFAAKERAEIDRRSGDAALDVFYRYWVCKEAVIKALGRGVAMPLDAVEISPPTETPALVRLEGRPSPGLWLRVLRPPGGLIAALATFEPVAIACHSWTG